MKENVSADSEKEEFSKNSARAVKTILYGGLTVGVLDALFALVFYSLIHDVKPIRIFQSVASGVLGKSSFEGGAQSFLLGVFLHFVVASCIAAVYYILSLRFSLLIEKASVCGIVYGVTAYLGMKYIVIPLSNAATGGSSPLVTTIAIIVHAFLVGLPIALITRHFAIRS